MTIDGCTPYSEATINLADGSSLRLKFRPNGSDLAVIKQVWEHSDYDFSRLWRGRGDELFRRYHELVAAGLTPIIIDAGANIGASSVYFARTFPKSVVICIEPQAANFALLQENTKELTNVVCHHAALAAADGYSTVIDPGEGEWGYRTAAADGTNLDEQASLAKVKAVSMATLLENREDCAPYLAKIDIEGGEAALFATATDWVGQFEILIIELHDWMFPGEASSKSFLQCIAPLGRDFIYLGENVFSIKNHP